jgi:hypothetical protein
MNLTDNEYREIAEELAEQDWDRFSSSVRDFVIENASDYIEGFARGGDHAAEALKMMRRDCIGYLADLMEGERVTERARDLFTETT